MTNQMPIKMIQWADRELWQNARYNNGVRKDEQQSPQNP